MYYPLDEEKGKDVRSYHFIHSLMNMYVAWFFATKDGEALYSQQKQDQELTVAQIMNSLLPNSDLNWIK